MEKRVALHHIYLKYLDTVIPHHTCPKSWTSTFYFLLTLKAPITTIVVCFVICLWFLKVVFANSVDPDQEQSDQGPHCLPVCKNRFEKSARIFSRRHKQTTFSDAVFLGALRVNVSENLLIEWPAARFVWYLPHLADIWFVSTLFAYVCLSKYLG